MNFTIFQIKEYLKRNYDYDESLTIRQFIDTIEKIEYDAIYAYPGCGVNVSVLGGTTDGDGISLCHTYSTLREQMVADGQFSKSRPDYPF